MEKTVWGDKVLLFTAAVHFCINGCCEVAVRMLALTYLSAVTLRTLSAVKEADGLGFGFSWLSRIPRIHECSQGYLSAISNSRSAFVPVKCVFWFAGLIWTGCRGYTGKVWIWSLAHVATMACGQVVVACPAHTYLFDPIVGTCLWDQWEPVGSVFFSRLSEVQWSPGASQRWLRFAGFEASRLQWS